MPANIFRSESSLPTLRCQRSISCCYNIDGKCLKSIVFLHGDRQSDRPQDSRCSDVNWMTTT